MEKDKISNTPSTCIKQCEMDFKTGLCKGCFRTIKEIADWGIMTEKQKQNVWYLIKRRKE